MAKELSLYHVQNSDRPMFVVAEDWNGAAERWAQLIAEEDCCTVEELGDDIKPDGVAMVCDADDLLLQQAGECAYPCDELRAEKQRRRDLLGQVDAQKREIEKLKNHKCESCDTRAHDGEGLVAMYCIHCVRALRAEKKQQGGGVTARTKLTLTREQADKVGDILQFAYDRGLRHDLQEKGWHAELTGQRFDIEEG
jgi:hypothetical protein